MERNDQLDQMQALMEQLVKMVGHNNAVTEELCQRVDRLETRLDRLETKVDNQGIRLDRLETKVNSLDTKVNNLETTMNNGFTDIIQMVTVLGTKVDKIDAAQALQLEMQRKLAADTAQHEAEITLLKRAK